MRQSKFLFGAVAVLGVALGVTVYAAGGSKKTAESCSSDNECSRGHCHTKQNGSKVCVDCSSSSISTYRGQIERFCKTEPRKCDNVPGTDEVAEAFFNARIESGTRCIEARKRENSECWNGGDDGHRQAADEAERSRKNCHDELNKRKGNGGIYTCSDSTYSSRTSDITSKCGAYGRACEAWSKDDKEANCREIEDAMKKTAECIDKVERLDKDCLPRLSNYRMSQFGKAKTAHDHCKDVLKHKKDKGLCK
jgi:hypothetical protein